MKERQSEPKEGFWRRLSRGMGGSWGWVRGGVKRGGTAIRRFVVPVGLGMLGGAALVILALALFLNQGVPSPVGPGFLGQLGAGQDQSLHGQAENASSRTVGQNLGQGSGQGAAGESQSRSGLGSDAANGGGTSSGETGQSSAGNLPVELTPQTQVTMIDWAWPVQGPVQERYGWFQHPIYQDWRLHAGIDIQVAPGTAVKAAAPGHVSSTFNDPVNSLTVVIDHGNGVQSIYGGLAQMNVKVGQELAQGEMLGRAGSVQTQDGRPYMYFAVKAGEESVDPLPLLPAGSDRSGGSDGVVQE